MRARHPVSLAFLVVSLGASTVAAQVKPQSKPAATVSSAAGIVQSQEHAVWTALAKNDMAAFAKALGGDFVYVGPNGAMRWEAAKSADMMKGCSMSAPWTLADMTTTPAGSDVMVSTYKASGEQTCNGVKSPSPIYALSVWQLRGGHWVAVAHSETTAEPPK